MTGRMIQQIEEARKQYLATFDDEVYFFKCINQFWDCTIPEAIELTEKLEEENINELLKNVMLDAKVNWRIERQFEKNLESYMYAISKSLEIDSKDSDLMLGYKLGVHIETLRKNMSELLQVEVLWNSVEYGFALSQKYREGYVNYVNVIGNILGLI